MTPLYLAALAPPPDPARARLRRQQTRAYNRRLSPEALRRALHAERCALADSFAPLAQVRRALACGRLRAAIVLLEREQAQ